MRMRYRYGRLGYRTSCSHSRLQPRRGPGGKAGRRAAGRGRVGDSLLQLLQEEKEACPLGFGADNARGNIKRQEQQEQ